MEMFDNWRTGVRSKKELDQVVQQAIDANARLRSTALVKRKEAQLSILQRMHSDLMKLDGVMKDDGSGHK